MDEKVYFQTKIVGDLDFEKDWLRYQHLTSRFELIRRVGICAILYVIYTSNYKYSDLITVAYIIGSVGAHVTTWFRLRNGTASFKEMLANNGGEPICNIISILHSNIVCVNPKTKNTKVLDYGLYSKYTETERGVLLIGSGDQLLMIGTTEMQGGTRAELITFLHNRCHQLKKKLVSETVGMVLAAAYVCTLAVFLALAIFA